MKAFARILGLLALLAPASAAADQPLDWMVGPAEEGSYVNLDFTFGGLQSSIEHREPIYYGTNTLTVRGSALAAFPFASTQADVDLRVLNLTLGLSGGYANVWRNQTFEQGAFMDRKERRERDAGGEFNVDRFPFWEARASLPFLLNDYVVFNHLTAWRVTDARRRSFDNITNVVHDGRFVRTQFQLFFKHKLFGALAPTFEILNFPLEDNWRTQYNYGFMYVVRAGLVQRDDILLWQMMFHSGEIFGGGYDNTDVYGMAVFRGPLTFMLAYRSVIAL
ncbi:MAG: hypothetical protein OXT09_34120 [Myxococcales bacterium]|nr:hypothetical protein [Myxococcales bacterium]